MYMKRSFASAEALCRAKVGMDLTNAVDSVAVESISKMSNTEIFRAKVIWIISS